MFKVQVFFVLLALWRCTWALSIVAQMANTFEAVKWALAQGANGVELDLIFEDVRPDRFQHSTFAEPCDCTCSCPVPIMFGHNFCSEQSICRPLSQETGFHCTAASTAQDMTLKLGNASSLHSRLALIYIDSQLRHSISNLSQAGANVVRLFNNNVMGRGYQGQIIIDAGTIDYIDYLRGAQDEARNSDFSERYFYTFGREGSSSDNVWNSLQQLETDQIVYSTGGSACLPYSYVDIIRSNVEKNTYASVGIWAMDLHSSMVRYVAAGADFIVTNSPHVAAGVISSSDISAPGSALVSKQVAKPRSPWWNCECEYKPYYIFFGGCVISRSAPPGLACHCSAFCQGQTVACADDQSDVCQQPDSSKNACVQGGGNCKGY